jgi:hypothetical protein
LLLSEGVQPNVMQERLGHSQIGITMNTYCQVPSTVQREAVVKVSAQLAGPKAARKQPALQTAEEGLNGWQLAGEPHLG